MNIEKAIEIVERIASNFKGEDEEKNALKTLISIAKLPNDSIFIKHLESHFEPGYPVICVLCNRTVKQIYGEAFRDESKYYFFKDDVSLVSAEDIEKVLKNAFVEQNRDICIDEIKYLADILAKFIAEKIPTVKISEMAKYIESRNVYDVINKECETCGERYLCYIPNKYEIAEVVLEYFNSRKVVKIDKDDSEYYNAF